MASQWKRNINLYIDINGEQISNDVKTVRKELQKIINDQAKMTIGSQEYQQAARNIRSLNGILAEHRQNIGQMQTPLQKVTEFAKGLLPALGAAALIGGIKSLVTSIVSVRKEFEKYEAVLANALGSHRQARIEMQMLQQFAAETPFSLQELTGAYVKLVNYGLKPSKDEMRKLGDLASSTGKGFDQLVEAVADAATGEFERLKEFGIKASKEGDKISFTFKGQTTVIDNNADSIKKYLVGLGDMQGVAGSMAAIAGTLGGKISNMGDAWDNLMNTMGAGSSGVMVTVITWLTNLINMFDGAFKSIKQIKEAVRDQAITDGMNNAIQEIDVMTKSLVKNGMSQNEAQKRALELYKNSMDETYQNLKSSYENATGDQKYELGKRLNLMKGEYNAVKEHYAGIDKITKKPTSDKVKKEASDKAIEALDQAQAQRNSAIVDQYEKEAKSQEWFQEQQLAAEMAYLVQKKAILADAGQSTVDIDNQIVNKRIEAQNKLAASQAEAYKIIADEALKLSADSDKADSDFVTEQIDKTNKAIEDSKRIQEDQAKAEQQILEQRQEAYLNFATMVGQNFGDLMADSEATFGDYLNAVLLMSLEALHQFLIVERAKALIKGAGSGFIGLAKAAAEIVLMEAAYQAVKGLLTPKKHATGGYTEGETTYIAGEAGTEWIAPNWMLQNPVTSAIIEGMENWRRNPVTLSTGAYNATKSISNSITPGFVSSSSSTPNSAMVIQHSGVTSEQLDKLNNVLDRVDKWNPKISIETLDKKWKEYDKVVKGGLK